MTITEAAKLRATVVLGDGRLAILLGVRASSARVMFPGGTRARVRLADVAEVVDDSPYPAWIEWDRLRELVRLERERARERIDPVAKAVAAHFPMRDGLTCAECREAWPCPATEAVAAALGFVWGGVDKLPG